MPGNRRRLPICGSRSSAWKAGGTGVALCRSALPALDRHLPGGGLALGARCTRWSRRGLRPSSPAAATLFIAGIAARLKGPVLWCLTRRDLFAPGLMSAGLHPDRVIYAETFRERDVLPVMEEGLREKGLAAVVGEVTRLGLTASRRLQLAAEASGVPALVLRRWWTVAEKELTGLADRRRHALAHLALRRPMLCRLLVSAAPAGRSNSCAAAAANPHSWILEACDAKGRLALPADLADRSDQAPQRRAAAG